MLSEDKIMVIEDMKRGIQELEQSKVLIEVSHHPNVVKIDGFKVCDSEISRRRKLISELESTMYSDGKEWS